MAKTKFELVGMNELKKSLKKLGKLPQQHVTTAARKGMNIVIKDAKANAPYDDGDLKKGIILSGERTTVKGKKVYRAVFDSKMNDIFQTKDKDGNVNGYYPFSQEYGYFTKNGRYVPGFYFMHNALSDNKKNVENTIVYHMKKKIDQEIRKARLK